VGVPVVEDEWASDAGARGEGDQPAGGAGTQLAGGVFVGLGDELLELGSFDAPSAAAAEFEDG
jgi:hypothetical protein